MNFKCVSKRIKTYAHRETLPLFPLTYPLTYRICISKILAPHESNKAETSLVRGSV